MSSLPKEALVPAAALASLTEVLARLRSEHLAGNDLVLAPICTRVMLRTTVNLRSPRPEQDRDPALVAKVVACLGDMGFALK